jgi:hypothetical protein
MKFNKIILMGATATMLLTTSCDKWKDFGDTNVDPNRTEIPSPAALLTNVLSQVGGFAAQTRGGLYAQQFSETQYTEVSLYVAPRLDFDAIYAGPLMDLQNIIKLNTDEGTKGNATKFGSNENQIATARILKAYIFWTITDRWGDVPYFDALQGASNLSPKYDKQEDIYPDLIKQLKEASDQFSGTPVTGDIIYGGDVTKWKKLANSLRMLIALRTSNVYPAPGQWAATEFAAAFADPDGYIATNADNFTLKYTGTVTAFRNPWYTLYNGRTDYAESKLMTDSLAAMGDPRQAAFGSNGNGFPYGLTRDQAIAQPSNYAQILAATWRATNSPLAIIGADDVLLAIAEAAQRGWITANVANFYKAGIVASWAQWNVTGDIATYLANARVALTGNASDDLRKIQLQQYLAWYPDGTQAWANWRRTGVPALVPTPNATNPGGKIPRRYTYGTNEYGLYTGNVNDAAGRYGATGDSPDSRVWWDKP